MNRHPIHFLSWALGIAILAGCGGGGSPGLRNTDPGDNDPNAVVAFGDSFTQGNVCACTPYPSRLAGLIGKTVYNTGVTGSMATENVDRAKAAIDRFHPAFLLILYGHNDITHGIQTSSIVEALQSMVAICRDNHVVPVLATYPEPIGDHAAYAPRVLLLNSRIRDMAEDLGLECVDLEAEFEPGADLRESDGLHPNDAGTQIIALACADLF